MDNGENYTSDPKIANAEVAQTIGPSKQAIVAPSRTVAENKVALRSQVTPPITPAILDMERLRRQMQMALSITPTVLDMESFRSQFASSILDMESFRRQLASSISDMESFRRQLASSILDMESFRRQLASSMLHPLELRNRSMEFPNTAVRTRHRRRTSEIRLTPDSYGIALKGSAGSRERSDALVYFDIAVTDRKLRQLCRKLVADGHYTLAVEQAFKYINNLVKQKSGDTEKDGKDLMFSVFSNESPVLMLNPLQSESEKNEQEGYRHIYAGVMMGIRNPRAHQHEALDSPQEAVERLVLANHLLRVLDDSTLSGSE